MNKQKKINLRNTVQLLHSWESEESSFTAELNIDKFSHVNGTMPVLAYGDRTGEQLSSSVNSLENSEIKKRL